MYLCLKRLDFSICSFSIYFVLFLFSIVCWLVYPCVIVIVHRLVVVVYCFVGWRVRSLLPFSLFILGLSVVA